MTYSPLKLEKKKKEGEKKNVFAVGSSEEETDVNLQHKNIILIPTTPNPSNFLLYSRAV